jgi:hypothetical protein
LLLGQATYIWLYNPGTDATHALFYYINPSIAACVVPAVTYAIGMKLLGWHEKSVRISEEHRSRADNPLGQRLTHLNI